MDTILTYLNNPSAIVAEGLVLANGKDNYGSYIITNTTPGYPQGGGQEGDRGEIMTTSFTTAFTNIRRVDGEIRHYLAEPYHCEPGNNITISVDKDLRWRHSALHTAGHLIGSLAYVLNPGFIPVKGHHFSEGSYVEFKITGRITDPIELEEFLKAAISLDRKSSKRIIITDYDKADGIISPFLQLIELPPGRLLRLVSIDTYPPIACGGTHLASLNELPEVTIRKIRYAKQVLRVSYSCF